MRVGSLFSGIGGIECALESLGMATAWQSEFDPHASQVLKRHWPDVPNLGDITAIDWAEVEPVDIICGGFPCQDISLAGKGAGIKDGTRSGLWSYFADAIGILRPRYVFVENVSALAVRGLDRVLCDLAKIGFDAEWTCIRASDIGAPHRRERLFLLATNADLKSGQQWRQSAPGQAQGGRPWTDACRSSGAPITDADSLALRQQSESQPGATVRPSLDGLVKMLPTPTVNDSRGGRNLTANRRNKKDTTQLGMTLTDWAYLKSNGETTSSLSDDGKQRPDTLHHQQIIGDD